MGEFRETLTGNPEPSPDVKSGKVQRLGEYTVKRPTRLRREEIVHAIGKLMGLCNRKVTGSNPVRGAELFLDLT